MRSLQQTKPDDSFLYLHSLSMKWQVFCIFHSLSMKRQVMHRCPNVCLEDHMSAVKETLPLQFLNTSCKADLCSSYNPMQSLFAVFLQIGLNKGFKLCTKFLKPSYSTMQKGSSCKTIILTSSFLEVSWSKCQSFSIDACGDKTKERILSTIWCASNLDLQLAMCLRTLLVPTSLVATKISFQ